MVTDRWKTTVRVLDLPLAERFSIATETWDTARNVFVVVEHEDAYGVGEVQPSERWDENPESVSKEIESADLTALRGPFDLEGVSTLLPPGAARSALDLALHDLAATLMGVPVADMLGLGGRDIAPTSMTVPIADLDTMVERARKLAHFPKLKMKVGFDGDVDAVGAIREVYGGDIRVDANEGWSEEEAIDRLPRLEQFRIELCEQPIRREQFDALHRVTEVSPIPVYADEDAGSAEDVARLAGVVDGVNLKLRKSGGIRELARAATVARAHGMGVMIGCDLESGIATSAGAHVAAVADFVDLDGATLLAEDPFPGVTYDGAQLVLPKGPGLLGSEGKARALEALL